MKFEQMNQRPCPVEHCLSVIGGKWKLLIRHDFDETPPRVECSVSDKGRSLIPIMGAMATWGEASLTQA